MGAFVGKNVGIPRDLRLSDRSIDRGHVYIGDRVEFAYGVKIVTTSGPFLSSLSDIYHIVAQPVIIKHDVWVGTNAVILHGVEIGEYSIIGAGCVVNEDVPPYSMATGNPMTVRRLPKLLIAKMKEGVQKTASPTS